MNPWSIYVSYRRNYLFGENAITKCGTVPLSVLQLLNCGFSGYRLCGGVLYHRLWRFPEPLQSSRQLLTSLCIPLIFWATDKLCTYIYIYVCTQIMICFTLPTRQIVFFFGGGVLLTKSDEAFQIYGWILGSPPDPKIQLWADLVVKASNFQHFLKKCHSFSVVSYLQLNVSRIIIPKAISHPISCKTTSSKEGDRERAGKVVAFRFAWDGGNAEKPCWWKGNTYCWWKKSQTTTWDV